jgi:hypothetical protein
LAEISSFGAISKLRGFAGFAAVVKTLWTLDGKLARNAASADFPVTLVV